MTTQSYTVSNTKTHHSDAAGARFSLRRCASADRLMPAIRFVRNRRGESSMTRVTFIAFNGTPHEVEVPEGTTLMRAATDNNVPGIDGDCGGQCACATCHVFVDPAWIDRVGERNSNEEEMLNFAAELRDSSRLACQITLTNALDGLVVEMPEGQH